MHNQKAVARFWAKSEVRKGCWGWLGTVYGSNGYPRMWTGTKATGAHRFSWEIRFGALPEGLHVLHKCDTPTCTNPEHLFLGTIADNNKDRARKGRSCRGDAHWQRRYPERRKTGGEQWTRKHPELVPRGERNGNSKLDAGKVRAIRELYKDGFSQNQIAKQFKIGQSTISSILLGLTWKHIT